MVTRIYLLVLIVLISSATPAAAYIDPVTGSIVVQAVLGGAAAALVSVRRWRTNLINFFRRDKHSATSGEASDRGGKGQDS